MKPASYPFPPSLSHPSRYSPLRAPARRRSIPHHCRYHHHRRASSLLSGAFIFLVPRGRAGSLHSYARTHYALELRAGTDTGDALREHTTPCVYPLYVGATPASQRATVPNAPTSPYKNGSRAILRSSLHRVACRFASAGLLLRRSCSR